MSDMDDGYVLDLENRVAELEAKVETLRERCARYVAQGQSLIRKNEELRGGKARAEAELAKVKEQWEFAAKAQLERSEKAEAEVDHGD
jgi:regulator of replication initiation timing